MKVSLTALLCLMAGIPLLSYAHQTKTDGPISIQLHVEPNDEPKTGGPTVMYIINDSEQAMSFADCDCMVSIVPSAERGKPDRTESIELIAGEMLSATVYKIEHTFTVPDVYAISLAGKPKTGANFEPFMIEFSVRVEEGDGTMVPVSEHHHSTAEHYAHVFPFIISAGVFGILVWNRDRKIKPHG